MPAPAKTGTNLGTYLRKLRLARGFDSVSDYLRIYNIPITSTYYRDLENGRKSVSFETSEQIRLALEADIHAFYYYYLKDLLPERIVGKLACPSNADTQINPHEAAKDERNSWFHLYLPTQFHILDDKTSNYFADNLELFSALLFIACNSPRGVSESQLEQFLKLRGIKQSVSEALKIFEGFGLIATTPATAKSPKLITSVRVLLPKQLKEGLRNKWLLAETTRSLTLSPTDKSHIRSGIRRISKSKYKIIQSLVADLMNEIRKADTGDYSQSQIYSSQIIISSPDRGNAK